MFEINKQIKSNMAQTELTNWQSSLTIYWQYNTNIKELFSCVELNVQFLYKY